MAATDQVISELVEDWAERVGLKPPDVMGALKKRVEHGSPPRNELEIPRRASGLCGAKSASERSSSSEDKPKEAGPDGPTPHNLEAGIITSERDRFKCAFTGAVVELEEPLIQRTLQRRPVIQRISDRLADRALRHHLGGPGAQPVMEPREDRPRSLLPQRMPGGDEGL